jgi:nitrogen fixation NifU-like protein
MMDDSLRELYQEVILDHSRHPRHFGPLASATHEGEGHNPLCGDRVKIYLSVDDAGRIADIKFEGKGCAISQASASLMTDMIAGRSVAEAEKLMDGFLHLVKGEDATDLVGDDRERLDIMAGVSAFPMRVKCATLAWHTMKSALEHGMAAKSE